MPKYTLKKHYAYTTTIVVDATTNDEAYQKATDSTNETRNNDDSLENVTIEEVEIVG